MGYFRLRCKFKFKALIITLLLIFLPKFSIAQSPASSTFSSKCLYLKNNLIFFKYENMPTYKHWRFAIKAQLPIDKLVNSTVTVNQLENIQRQLLLANEIYTQILGLPEPLYTPRYKDAKFIATIIKPAKKKYGRAYDEVISNHEYQDEGCHTAIQISNQIFAERNLTPAHELFHIYQNSQMMFKQAWLSEGTARWAESLFAPYKKKQIADRLPQNKQELLNVMQQSYAASKMWQRLFMLLDENKQFTLPISEHPAIYTNGELIVEDNVAYGTRYIKILFSELNKQSIKLANEQGWATFGWQEKEQKNAKYNPYIWQAVQRSANLYLPKDQQSQELKNFLSIDLSTD